jgi:hypothetical protein
MEKRINLISEVNSTYGEKIAKEIAIMQNKQIPKISNSLIITGYPHKKGLVLLPQVCCNLLLSLL